MEANTRKLERIFDQTITYQVPLFQRPYVWTKEKNLEPLWEDIQSLLDNHLRGKKVNPHFLGAVVLEQLANSTGSIESRQVIDGQQRFTTLQLFLIAARDLATFYDHGKYIERFTDLVANRRSKIDHDVEVFKVWPTNSNRAAFRVVHGAGSPANVEKVIKENPHLASVSNNIINGYLYFHAQLLKWLNGDFDDDEDKVTLSEKTTELRLESLWQVVKDSLHVVVIDLDHNDETQVIFETLNARGEDLLPADLIKNFLFRRVTVESGNIEELYENHWHEFELPWWREEIKHGRIFRPRVDFFMSHYLTMMTREEVKSSHLFNAFKAFVEKPVSNNDTLLDVPKSAEEHIKQLSRYAKIFKSFSKSDSHKRLALFLRRLDAIDTTTVYPFMLYAYAALIPENTAEFDKIIGLVESYLIRRMVCGMTGKNYNRYFVDLIRFVSKNNVLTAASVAEYMLKSTAESSRYPDDQSFRSAASDWPLYDRLAQYKVRTILEALDAFAQNSKSEVQALPSGLTIEHVMPQSWQANWPLDESVIIDPETKSLDLIKEQTLIQRRKRLVQTLGNLTLVTSSLNPALSNSAWEIKRPELMKFSKLNLTQYFHENDIDRWSEESIEKRTSYLCDQLVKIWPELL